MDAFGKGMEKRELIERNFIKRILFKYEKKMLYDYENRVFDFVDRFCIISKQDRDSIKSSRAEEIKIIPNGVDFEMFYPRMMEKKYDLLFMGNLGYPPNIDAIKFLYNEIMPLVTKQLPNIKLLIAGINAPNSIRKMQSVNVDIIEKFENISDSIALSKIMIAPMKISIGLQNKIIQAMAMKTPCIVSSISNNAIQAKDNSSIIEANSPIEFSEKIVELINNEVKANKIGLAGYDFVIENFSWSIQNDLMTNLLINKNERTNN